MSEVIGVVEKVFEKNGRYAILMDGTWYGNGYHNPNVQEGATVKFQVEMNGKYANIMEGSIQSKPGSAPAPAPAPQKKAWGGNKGSAAQRDQYWVDKAVIDIVTQKRISYQAATNTAIALISAAMSQDCLPIPKGGKVADKFEAFKQMVMEEADNIFVRYQLVPEFADDLMKGDEPVKVPVDEAPPANEADDEWVTS